MLVVGEEVPHVHVHLVPFTALSQMSFANQDTSPAAEDLDEQADALRTAAAGRPGTPPSYQSD